MRSLVLPTTHCRPRVVADHVTSAGWLARFAVEVKATSRTAATRDDDDDNRGKDLRRKKK